MTILKDEELQAINDRIDAFKKSFYQETGYKPTVTVPGLVLLSSEYTYINKPTLLEIEECINKFIPEWSPYRSIQAITRKRYMVDLRKVFSRIARDIGYTWRVAGEHFGKDHTTMIHNYNHATDLIGHDPEFTLLYTNILKALNDDFGVNDRNSQTESEPQSVISDDGYTGQDNNCPDQPLDGTEDPEDRWLGNRRRLSYDPSPKFAGDYRKLVPSEEQEAEEACLG